MRPFARTLRSLARERVPLPAVCLPPAAGAAGAGAAAALGKRRRRRAGAAGSPREALRAEARTVLARCPPASPEPVNEPLALQPPRAGPGRAGMGWDGTAGPTSPHPGLPLAPDERPASSLLLYMVHTMLMGVCHRGDGRLQHLPQAPRPHLRPRRGELRRARSPRSAVTRLLPLRPAAGGDPRSAGPRAPPGLPARPPQLAADGQPARRPLERGAQEAA